MNVQELYTESLCDLTDEELEFLLSKARRPGFTNLWSIAGTAFGYSHLVEEEILFRECVKDGFPDKRNDPKTFFEVKRRKVERHKNDAPMSEYQKVLIKKVESEPKVEFTDEELVHIRDHFMNANDPFVQNIVAKIDKMLYKKV